jgi:ABC-type dipeptide/oligopeptide/nickel transport system ATPase component
VNLSSVPVLKLDNLRVVYRSSERMVTAVDNASIIVGQGESIGIVGESGSGKSTLARSIISLHLGNAAVIERGDLAVEGINVEKKDWKCLRGNKIAMVFQDPLSYLNPIMSIGRQIAEAVRRHDVATAVDRRVSDLLEYVHLPKAVKHSYPHELSGGMRQRVLLAIALACRPKILIADEPTTALDVTTQGEILALIESVRKEMNMALLLISHDLGVVSHMCDRVYIMLRGKIVEEGRTTEIFESPRHPYTVGLLNAALAVTDERGRFVTIESEAFRT